MSRRYCKTCGNKIPRLRPSTAKKTKKNRMNCYNCSPLKEQANHPHKSERRKRKETLVKILGGHCAKCGYHENVRALSFHHKCPEKKQFDISSNGNLMQDWEIVLKEALKCQLLCLNCHAEQHS